MSSVADWLNGCLKSVKHEIFKDVVKVHGEYDSMAEAQVVLVSDVQRVNLKLETSSGEQRDLKAIVKSEAPSGLGKTLAEECEYFENETMMYSTVLKQMERLMSEVGDNKYPWPDSYHCADNKFLLQDLCEAGYNIVPTQDFLDVNHTLLVMKAIGKFHALSMIMNSRGTLDKTKLRPGYVERGPKPIMDYFKMSVDPLPRHIKKTWGSEWSSVAERLSKYIDDIKPKFHQLAVEVKGKWDVLNHGDFSMRNMLFHYKPNSNVPDDVKFVDFQLIHYNNLGFDLSCLLFSSLDPSVRDANMNLFLGTYAESLAATCKQYQYGGPVPTLEDVSASLKSVGYFANYTSFCFIPLFVNSGSEDMQKKTSESLDVISGAKPAGENVFECYYQNDKIVKLMDYEVKRCIKENVF